MADKTVKELAEMVSKTVSELQQQLVDAGMPERGEDDLVTELEQEQLVAYLKQSHGQERKRRISLKSKTTSTARVTGSSGKAKSVNVEVRKKKVFEKPDPNKLAEEIAAREKAVAEAKERALQEAKQKEQEDVVHRQDGDIVKHPVDAVSGKHHNSKQSELTRP